MKFDPRQHPRKADRCGMTGKRRFHSQEAALIRGGEILTEPRCRQREFRAYLCEYCAGWHLTTH